MKAKLEELIQYLEKQHQAVMGAENSALAALEKNDLAAYSRYMHEKAELLAELRSKANPLLEKLSPSCRDEIGKTLTNFSHNANMALELDSTFYMSALLYPDDHKKGEPDNLARLIEKLKSDSKES